MGNRIAIINFDAFGHVIPTLPLTTELVERGNRVEYFVPRCFHGVVASTGATLVDYNSLIVATAIPRLEPSTLLSFVRSLVVHEAAHVAGDLLIAMSADPPDIILYDRMCRAGALVADALGIPSITLNPSYAANANYPAGDPIGYGSDGAYAEQIHADMAALRGIGSDLSASADRLLRAAAPTTIIFMSRQFHPVADAFGPGYVFVGPQISANEARPMDSSRRMKRIYVTLGTVVGKNPGFYRDCINAFVDIPYTVCIATGFGVCAEDIGPVPKNFEIVSFTSQRREMATAEACVIHGGVNSVQDAIWYNTPMVIAPQAFDQFISARRVEELGCGTICADTTSDRWLALRASLENVLSSSTIPQALLVQREHANQSGGFRRAADIIERAAGRPEL